MGGHRLSRMCVLPPRLPSAEFLCHCVRGNGAGAEDREDQGAANLPGVHIAWYTWQQVSSMVPGPGEGATATVTACKLRVPAICLYAGH